MGTLERISSEPDLVERAYRRLADAICAGDLAPGARIKQDEIAATLGVSRQPVHQALRLLKKEGFVVDAGRRGLMVSPLDARSLAQLYEVRGALDGLAARLAARAGAQIDPAVIEEGRRSAGAGRVGALIEADMRFHQAIYVACGNPLVGEAAARNWQHIRRAMGVVLQPGGAAASVWDEHAAVLAAINRGDAEEAERLARTHCEAAGRHIGARMAQPEIKEKLA